MLLVALPFIGLGCLVFLAISHAATVAGPEAESGTSSTNASVLSDSSASGGLAVKFGTGASAGSCASSTANTPDGADPWGGCFPGPLSAGWRHTGVTLTKLVIGTSASDNTAGWTWSGSQLRATKANASINQLEIPGSVDTSSYNGVTITKSWIRCTNESSWCVSTAQNTSLTDVEIGDSSSPTAAIGVYTGGPNNTFLRADIHDTSDGMRTDGGTTVTDSYIHTLSYPNFPGAHSDGSQTTDTGGPVGPIIFRHNTVQGGNNAGLFFQAGNTTDVENNYLVVDTRAGQVTSFGVVIGGTGPVTIKNNLFDHGFQPGPINSSVAPSGSIICGDKYTDAVAIDTACP